MTTLPPIAWPPDGLVPVVIVDDRTGDILTLAYANREALERTLATGSTWLYSRSRARLWNKGETSGNTQAVVGVAVDCDADALIYRVIPSGPACHTGARSCFEPAARLDGEAAAQAGTQDAGRAAAGTRLAGALAGLAATIADRKRDPVEGSYTAKLFAGGVDRIGKKIGEEATEVVIAAKNDDRRELIWETADLLYHTLVMLAQREIDLDEVGAELTRRATPAA